MKDRIANRIRTIRLTKGFSQQNMADELNISPSAYSNIERGVADMNLTRLTEIADILEVELYELMGEHEHMANEMSPEPYETSFNQQLNIIMQQIQLFQQQITTMQRDIAQIKSKL